MEKTKARMCKARNRSNSGTGKKAGRRTTVKLGKYETKWIKVYGDIGDGEGPTYLFNTRTMVKDILPGLTIHGLGEVRYSYEEEKKDDKAKVPNN